VDVKISKIPNLKMGCVNLDDEDFHQKATRTSLPASQTTTYQVQDYKDDNHYTMETETAVEKLEEEEENPDECEGCERLKLLVFQAKEAIDDLKLEIEEWREIAAEKDTELR
jgi:hypothetical protein